jgi:hypothetical protein
LIHWLNGFLYVCNLRPCRIFISRIVHSLFQWCGLLT